MTRLVKLKIVVWFTGVGVAAFAGLGVFLGYAAGSVVMLWWKEI